jgi:hypothetical protein
MTLWYPTFPLSANWTSRKASGTNSVWVPRPQNQVCQWCLSILDKRQKINNVSIYIGRQEEKRLKSSFCLLSVETEWIHGVYLYGRRLFIFLNPPNQILILSRKIFTDIAKIMFNLGTPWVNWMLTHKFDNHT